MRNDADDDASLLDQATRDVVTATTSDSAQTALRIMVDEHVEHVPVIDTDRILVGICTRTDLLKVRRRQLELERRQAGIATRLRATRRKRARKDTAT